MMITIPKIHSFERENDATKESFALRRYIDIRLHYFFFKRIVDFIIALLVIVLVMSWLFPIVSLLILLESRGPVLFIQRRVGRGGRTFRCLKFRTMVVNAEANIRQAQENDHRITRVGYFLRRSNLDEFPQFFNVLVGHMSVVGPRPHMHADCNRFAKAVAGYKFRNLVKPGITGLAQVKGFRGPTKSFESIFHRYQFDAFYVRNANMWLDLRIIRKTVVQTISGLFSKMLSKTETVVIDSLQNISTPVTSVTSKAS